MPKGEFAATAEEAEKIAKDIGGCDCRGRGAGLTRSGTDEG